MLTKWCYCTFAHMQKYTSLGLQDLSLINSFPVTSSSLESFLECVKTLKEFSIIRIIEFSCAL